MSPCLRARWVDWCPMGYWHWPWTGSDRQESDSRSSHTRPWWRPPTAATPENLLTHTVFSFCRLKYVFPTLQHPLHWNCHYSHSVDELGLLGIYLPACIPQCSWRWRSFLSWLEGASGQSQKCCWIPVPQAEQGLLGYLHHRTCVSDKMREDQMNYLIIVSIDLELW